jgi:ABC-type amino acid transport substrate-binding protein
MRNDDWFYRRLPLSLAVVFTSIALCGLAAAADLPEIRQRGVLRHLGIPYANFITGSGDGLDVEIVKLFADHLGVRYEYVPTSWEMWVQDLTGSKVEVEGDEIKKVVGPSEIKGDLIACGLTILPWREKVADFSNPTFPTQVWLLTRGDFPAHPIKPSQDIDRDIGSVKALFKEGYIKEVMGKKATCLDPDLYDLPQTGVACKLANLNLNELAPALINGEAESVLLDVPDALIALEKWTGQLKVIGPISELQFMSAGFPKDAVELRRSFNEFLVQCRKDGTYLELIKKYYPSAHIYFPEFFKDVASD